MAYSGGESALDIVITARRIEDAFLQHTINNWLSNVWNNIPYNLRDPQWFYGPYSSHLEDYTSPNHLKRQLIDTAKADFIEHFEYVESLIDILDDNSLVSIANGQTISGLQLKEKIGSIKFIIVNTQFRDGYGGANFGDRVEINWQTFAGYVANGREGVAFLVFHEIAHNTPTGLATRSWTYNSFLDTHRPTEEFGPGNTFFQSQESFTNTIAKEMANSVGISIQPPSNPNFPAWGFAEF